MARMLSHIMSIIRGSVAGITYSANTFHQIVARQRTAPVQPGTNYQTHIKTAFTSATNAWRIMLYSQRELWNDYAKTLIYIGPLGPYKLPGRSVFISNFSAMLNLYYRGVILVPLLPTPPAKPGFLGLSISSQALPSTGVGYKIRLTNPNDESIDVYCERSWAYDQTRTFFKGPWMAGSLKLVTIAPGATGTIEYLDLNLESVYFNVLRAISTAAPIRISMKQYFRAVAVAALPPG